MWYGCPSLGMPLSDPQRSFACRAVDDETHGQDCPFNIQLKWMAEATSSIYATPLITDLYADGYKDIIVPSFVHYLEVFQGDNGAQASGFPAFHADKVHASPMLFDIDHDGIQDIVIVTYNGEVRFYEDSGAPLEYTLKVPGLPVDRCALEALHNQLLSSTPCTESGIIPEQLDNPFSSDFEYAWFLPVSR